MSSEHTIQDGDLGLIVHRSSSDRLRTARDNPGQGQGVGAMRRKTLVPVVAAALLLAVPQAVHGYVGPGAGLTIIGAAVAFVVSLVLGLIGFVWYPMKRLKRAWSEKRRADYETVDS
jgi:Na+-driven multidrug efflux pump